MSIDTYRQIIDSFGPILGITLFMVAIGISILAAMRLRRLFRRLHRHRSRRVPLAGPKTDFPA